MKVSRGSGGFQIRCMRAELDRLRAALTEERRLRQQQLRRVTAALRRGGPAMTRRPAEMPLLGDSMLPGSDPPCGQNFGADAISVTRSPTPTPKRPFRLQLQLQLQFKLQPTPVLRHCVGAGCYRDPYEGFAWLAGTGIEFNCADSNEFSLVDYRLCPI